MPRRLFAVIALLMSFNSAFAGERWQSLPPTPAPVAGAQAGYAEVNGIRLYYSKLGHGSPVVLLHGGLGNADYWGLQAKALAARHTVISVDSRGHGRSTRDARPYGYDLMADDVIALLDQLKIPRADFVGWSDGAILGLDLAMRYPQRSARSSPTPPTPRPQGSRKARRTTRPSPPTSSAPARSTPACPPRPRSTRPLSSRSATCGPASRTGATPTWRRSRRRY